MSLPSPSSGARAPQLDPATMKALDKPLVELANLCGGDLRQLLFAFFNFLHRRTDFYMVPNDEDIKAGMQHKMGFREGDAEKLMIAAFRQFPLRRMPKRIQQQQQQPTKGGSSLSLSNQPRRDPPGEMQSFGKKDPPAQLNEPKSHTQKITTPTATTPEAPASASAAQSEEEIRFTDEGKQVPIGNGGVTTKYRWTQTLEETTIVLPVPAETKGKDFSVSIKSSSISVKLNKPVNGETSPRTLLEGKLSSTIQKDESTWSLEGGAMLLILQKLKNSWWENVLEGDDMIDTTLVDSRRHISSYDDSTQAAIRKILFDERQRKLGLPTSDQILRKEGQNPVPPLPDGVEYINRDTLAGDTGTERQEA